MIDLRDPAVTAAQVIAALALQPHPEGGHYREIWRDAPVDGSRGAGTAIYFLLAADAFSHWHRVDAAEAWHWYAGGPLALSMSADGHDAEAVHLGPDLTRNQRPFAVVPQGCGCRPSYRSVMVNTPFFSKKFTFNSSTMASYAKSNGFVNAEKKYKQESCPE